MDNWPDWGNLVLAYCITTIIFQFIYLLDRRVKKEGPLFTQRPSGKSRLSAALTGVVLLGAFIIFWRFGPHASYETVLLIVAAIALFGYAAGITTPLADIQKGYSKTLGHSHGRPLLIDGIDRLSREEVISQVQRGAKFVYYDYCISPLVVCLDYHSNIFFVRSEEERKRKARKYILLSVFFGWFSLFGPFNTLQCLKTDLNGGIVVTQPIYNTMRKELEVMQDKMREPV